MICNMVSAVSPEFIPEAERQIKTLLRERHRLKSNQDDDFMIRNLADVAATAQSTNQSMCSRLDIIINN